MKHVVSELEGALLDAAVVLAVLGKRPLSIPPLVRDTWGTLEDARFEAFDYESIFEPSTRWDMGGPIIEKHAIMVCHDDPKGKQWYANVGGWMSHDYVAQEHYATGPTYLTAAMRAFVRMRIGDEVDL